MGRDPSFTIATLPETIASKLEQEDVLDMDVHGCLALPSSLQMFAVNASSPNSSSSTTSSSMAELCASPGLGNETGHSSIHSENDGGDSTSTVSTAAGSSDRERSLECSHISLSSNIPPPITEKCPIMPSNEAVAGCRSEDRGLDVKPSVDDACLSDTCCGQDSSSDGMYMSRLDGLLQSDTPQEFAAESGLACVDDLFPNLSTTGQDFSLLDDINTWSTESLQSLDALPFPEEEFLQADSALFDGEENAAQMFTQWLRINAHWISLSDLRKIKLRTSTIENTIRRLGGGKKGMMLFLKLVLMWVQNSRMKRSAPMEATLGNGLLSSGVQSRASLSGTSAMSLEGGAMRDGLHFKDSSSAMQGSGVEAHTLSGCGSPLPPMAVNSSCPDWTSRAQWTQTPVVEHNATISSPRYSTLMNGRAGSPLHSTTLGHFSSSWPVQSNMLYGTAPSSMPPSVRSPASASNGCVGGGGAGDSASMMMLMQQQQCSEANPAATTRAARKSRMERQRWSVRHNRKWSAAAHQSQQRLASAVSNGSVHANVRAWSQGLGGTLPNLPFPNSRACQQSTSSRSTVMECQQNKKQERNLSLLFQKELKQSDVGNLGRIVLPKAAETFLPALDLRDGVNLVVEDMNSAKVWNMRYRFWPNNKSRMYLLENTSDFVKSYDLKEGDYMKLFRDNVTNRFVIRGAKGPGQAGMPSGVWNVAKRRKSFSEEAADLVMMGSTNSEESCDDSLLAELIEQSLEDLKESET